ncbi:VOC family protein [Serinicoccus profundi]|uniref:VOC family protein n=1 Tax=Serinicoccus profundi TaxID=1078471 RepID=UPI000255E80A|nr:VOC family protein [Serinicoccus profundi]
MHLHHVQIAIPTGGEDEARRFYGAGLGLTEVEKPAELAGRGGCWFRDLSTGATTLEIHLGVEDPFTPARKAHPGIVVEDVATLEALAARVAEAGFEVSWAERTSFTGFERFHCRDGFGNRVEVMTPVA